MKRIHIVAATIAALAVLSGGALYVRSSSAETKPAACDPRRCRCRSRSLTEQEVTTWDEFSGRLEAVERVDVRSRVAGAVQSVHFREGALVKPRRPAGHDRSRAVRGRSRARRRRRSSRRRRALDYTRERAASARSACGTRAPSRSASSTSASTPARGRGQPARRAGRAAVGAPESRLHAGARAGVRPRRQARGDRRQPGRRRSRRAGADDAGVGEPDLRQLRRRRAGGRCATLRRRRANSRASRSKRRP